VFEGYVDDCRNTDNAWVETTVLNIHLDRASQVMVDVNNMVRRTPLAYYWVIYSTPTISYLTHICHLHVIMSCLSGGEQPQWSSVAGGEQQNQTGLKPKTLTEAGCSAAQQEVLTFAPL